MLFQLKKEALRGYPYRQTVQTAYTLVSTWLSRSQPSRTGQDDHVSVFVLSDSMIPKDAKPPASARPGTPPQRSAEDTSALAVKTAHLAARVCYHCHGQGHVRRNCPKRKDKSVHFAGIQQNDGVGEDDPTDLSDVNCMVASAGLAGILHRSSSHCRTVPLLLSPQHCTVPPDTGTQV